MTASLTALRFAKVFLMTYRSMCDFQPGTPHAELALVDTIAIINDPLFDDDRLNVATVVGAEEEESSLRIDAIGDHGMSCGPLQKWGGCRLSVYDGIIAGIDQMRVSFAMSRTCLWCGYLGGPHGVESDRVRRMSRHRERVVSRLLGELMSTGDEVAVRP